MYVLIGGAIYYVSPFSAVRAGSAPSHLLQSTYSTRKCTQQVKPYFLEADKLFRSIARHQQRPGGREEQEAELAWWSRSRGWRLCVL